MTLAEAFPVPTGEIVVPESEQEPPAPAAPGRRRGGRTVEVVSIIVIATLLISSLAAGVASLYRLYWGPEAFIERYLSLLEQGYAADALTLPGVAVDTEDLDAAGIGQVDSDALLRSAALPSSLSDAHVLSSRMVDGVAEVTVSFVSDGQKGESTYRVEQSGWTGLVPSWQFETSPLAVLDVTVRGSMRFAVNGFELDKRQISPAGLDADPLAPVSLLVFTPGAYAVSVDTPVSEADDTVQLAENPLTEVEYDVQTEATSAFIETVSEQVDQFLDACTQQQVLQPARCPFGYETYERVSVPEWSIKTQPKISIVPDGASWAIEPAGGIAHIDVDVTSVYDGSVAHVSEDVTFTIDGTIDILDDGSAAIQISSPDAQPQD
ncbi:MAG: hypothetical protein QM607_12675 [Microbacterium sp.]